MKKVLTAIILAGFSGMASAADFSDLQNFKAADLGLLAIEVQAPEASQLAKDNSTDSKAYDKLEQAFASGKLVKATEVVSPDVPEGQPVPILPFLTKSGDGIVEKTELSFQIDQDEEGFMLMMSRDVKAMGILYIGKLPPGSKAVFAAKSMFPNKTFTATLEVRKTAGGKYIGKISETIVSEGITLNYQGYLVIK